MKTNENQTVSKICKNCEASTIECTTGKTYCCDVSWLRMLLAGPRLVLPTNTCRRCILKQVITKSR